jgi:hypothetical protein
MEIEKRWSEGALFSRRDLRRPRSREEETREESRELWNWRDTPAEFQNERPEGTFLPDPGLELDSFQDVEAEHDSPSEE